MLEAARRGATTVGYELSPILWAIAWVRSLRKGRVKIYFRNFYKQTLPPKTNRIFAFLMPNNMARVAAFLKEQKLPHKTLVFAYAFPFADAEPLTIIRTKNCAPLYIYELQAITKPQ